MNKTKAYIFIFVILIVLSTISSILPRMYPEKFYLLPIISPFVGGFLFLNFIFALHKEDEDHHENIT